MTFRTYIQSHYTRACQRQIEIKDDDAMVEMLRAGREDPKLVSRWMLGYKLFQGITSGDRRRIVSSFLSFARTHKRNSRKLSRADIEVLYTELFTRLYRAVPRSWLSATSKLLWCLYPDGIVIYDRFVYRTLAVMQCLDDNLEGFDRIGNPPVIKDRADIAVAVAHYMNFQDLVHRLRSVHQPLLDDLRKRHRATYRYDIRILDKLLWMVGNSGKDFDDKPTRGAL